MEINVIQISDLPEVTETPFDTGFFMVEHGEGDTEKLALQQLKADLLNNTALTGEPTAPTAIDNDTSQRIANTQWVQTRLAALGLNPASSSEYGTVRTNSTDAVPVVYLKSEVDALLAPLQSLEAQLLATIDAIFPAGSIIAHPSSTAPTGFLACNGQTVSRATYSRLFSILSTTFGAGDGSTTFTLPNIQGRVIMGAGLSTTGVTRAVGATLGTETVTLTTAEMPAHSHTVGLAVSGIQFGFQTSTSGSQTAIPRGPAATGTFVDPHVAITNGGGGAHLNVQPSICFHYYIRF